jgi:AraC family transcriptional regulator of adaptative response/methylated-DNA-[protein]-cysteine methyltransferase
MTAKLPDATDPKILRYAFAETVLGTIAVAAGHRGIVALFIGDTRENLLRDLRDAFPTNELIADESELREFVAKAILLVNAPHLRVDLRLDLSGSPVETAVWKALREIPPGETRTYGAIAKDLPIEATAQDVGAACAANRIAVAVPCHRVVKSDGSISGYRWGVHRKRRLINMEGVA